MTRIVRWFRYSKVLPAHKEDGASWPLLAGVILAVWLVYAFWTNMLDLPFYEDDFMHLRWLQGRSLFEPFLTAEFLPTYRPLGESLLKFWFLVQGRHDPVWLRFQNIALTAINAALVARLATWVDRSRRRFLSGGLAALFFTALPFAYQAIPWINVFFYPLETFLLLSTALAYWKARESGRLSWLLLAWFFCFLSPFEIEQGLMANTILLAVELILWIQRRQPYPWLTGPAVGGLLNVLFFILWQMVPKLEYSFGPPTADRLYVIWMYFLQGLIYPVAPLALLLEERLGWHDLEVILVMGLLTVGGLTAALLRRRRTGSVVLALIWFVAFSLIPSLMVAADYVINSPRLLYLVGPAIGWLWGGALAEGWYAGRLRRLSRWGVILLLLFTLTYSAFFVAHKDWLYHLGTHPILEVTRIAQEAKLSPEANDPRGLLFVNLPAWLAATNQYYAIGSHGAQLIPPWVNIQDVIYAQTGDLYPASAVRFDETVSPQPPTYWHSRYGTAVDRRSMQELLSTHREVFVTEYLPDRIRLRLAGRATDVPWVGATVVFSDEAALGPVRSVTHDEEIVLDLTWLILAETPSADLTIFVHLVGPNGKVWAQADGYPIQGLAPFWLWGKGQILSDRRYLPWPADSPPGLYRIAIGLYNHATLERVPAFTPQEERFPDDYPIVLSVERTP